MDSHLTSMISLLALFVHAQGFSVDLSSYPLVDTPTLAYGVAPIAPSIAWSDSSVAGIHGVSSIVSQLPTTPTAFAIRQADRLVKASEVNYEGHNFLYNVEIGYLLPFADLSKFPQSNLLDYGNVAKADAAQQDEHRLQLEIDHFRVTHPEMTREDRNTLENLVLQRESARSQKLRRVTSLFPDAALGTGAPISTFFARRANQLDFDLAQNSLQDARATFQSERNKDNLARLRNAQDNVKQADQRRDANTLDLLGSFNDGAKLGPVFRKAASQTKLDIGYRNLRAARKNYDDDPNEDSQLILQLAHLFIRATEEEDNVNEDEILVTTLFPPRRIETLFAGKIALGLNSQNESRLWLRYDRLKRKILLRQQEKALQSGSASVFAQMLSLSSYGRV